MPLPDTDASHDAEPPKRSPVFIVRTGLLAAILVLAPIELWTPLSETGLPTVSIYYRWVLTLVPLDPILIAFTILSIPVVLKSLRSRPLPWSVLTMASLIGWALLSLVANPTLLGVTFIARWIGALAIVSVIGALQPRNFRTYVIAPLLASGSIQAVIALWQHPGPGHDLLHGGVVSVSYGTYLHQAGLALLLAVVIATGVATLRVDRTRIPWLIAIGLASAAATGTMSRAGGLALMLIWLIYAWSAIRRPRFYGTALAVSAIPFMVTVTLTYSGWFSRVGQSMTGSINQRSSGRVELVRMAVRLIKDNPLFGVGPGGYLDEVHRLHPTWTGWELLPVHVTPLLAAAELGILGGLIIVAVLILYGFRASQTSPAALAVFAPIAVYLIFEQRTYYIPADVVLFAAWMAILDQFARPSTIAEPEPTMRR